MSRKDFDLFYQQLNDLQMQSDQAIQAYQKYLQELQLASMREKLNEWNVETH